MPPNTKANIMPFRYTEVQFKWKIPDFFLETDIEKLITYESPAFSFISCECTFSLYRHSSADYMNLYVNCSEIKKRKAVEFYFGIKKLNGSVCQLFRAVIVPNQAHETNLAGSLSKLKLMKQKNELTTNGALTIACTVKSGRAFHIQSSALDDPMKFKKLDTLSENFKSILSDKDNYDVTLQVKGQNFNAHRVILMARSPVFAAMFRHDSLEKQTGIVNILDCDPDSFHEFLEFLYCGELKNIAFRSAVHLYKTAHKYVVEELKSFCIEYMERYMSNDNVCDVLVLADMYDETDLLSAAETFMQLNAYAVIETTTWQSFLKNHYPLADRVIKVIVAKIKLEK